MCGIFGYVGSALPDIDKLKKIAYLGGTRGCHSYGISYISGGAVKTKKGLGKIPHETVFNGVESKAIIGHCRLCTIGKPTITDAQPLSSDGYSVAVNGTIRNYREFEKRYNLRPMTSNDSEVLLLLSKMFGSIEALGLLRGQSVDPFASMILTNNSFTAFRRKLPLYIEKTDSGLYLCSRKFDNAIEVTQNEIINIKI